jgi:hypothetical protein
MQSIFLSKFSLSVLLLPLISFFFSTVAAKNYPQIHENRPRIYADSTRIAWLKNNITLAGDCQTTFNEFDYRYNNWWINDPQLYLTGNDSTQWTWNWGSVYAVNEAVFTILMYRLKEDSLSLKRCRFLAQKTIDTLNNVNYLPMTFYDKEAFVRKFSDVGSLLIDWCGQALPDTLLHELVRAQYSMNREFMNFFILSAAGNSYVSSHNAWNCVYVNQNALALHHAPGLNQAQWDTVQIWYEAVYDKWINGFLPCYGYYRDDDGGWNWGAAYSMWSLVDQFQLFDNMLIGTGKNFYSDLPWVQNSINQYWYFIQPDEYCIHSGDGLTRILGDRVIYRHASLFNDPRSVWLAQKYAQPIYYNATIFVFNKLLYKDFTIPVIPKPNPSLKWWSDKSGLSVNLSAWDSLATMTSFFNSPSKRAAHEHRDNNSFTVFKSRPLILDAGYYDTYGGTHMNNYYHRSIAHNTICVFDSTESYTNFGQPAANDGGQIESIALQNFGHIIDPANKRGDWIQYAEGNNYQYNVADAQLSYNASKLDFFRRKFLVLNSNKIIVLDYVHLVNTTTEQRDAFWINHYQRKPQMSGTLLNASVPGNIETYSAGDYTFSYGDGSAAVRTLLPTAANATLVGGPGFEFYVNGLNYPPLNNPDTVHGAPGNWRLEIRPNAISDSLVFLHSIQVGNASNPAQPGGLALSSWASTGADWADTLFYFAQFEDTLVNYHFFNNVSGGRTISIFAADLNPGNYFVLLNGISQGSYSSDAYGILQCSIVLPAGQHLIEITDNVTDFRIPGSAQLTIAPNPNNGKFMINYPSFSSFCSISIFNAQGVEVPVKWSIYQSSISIELNVDDGFYLLRVKDYQDNLWVDKILVQSENNK